MAGYFVERRLIIGSCVAEGYQLTEIGLKNLQHVFTVWFPRAIYPDLTDDTVRIDVVVRVGRTTGKGVYSASFLTADGTVIKKIDYDEDRLIGKVCNQYDQRKSSYYGKKDGLDLRMVIYTTAPTPMGDRR
jgi:hypothetical protein